VTVNTVFYKFDVDEVRFILNYGRPFSPMSPWGLVGGGPLNTQQIDNLLAYLKSIQIPRENCAEGEDPLICDAGNLPAAIQTEIQTAAEKAVADGKADTLGEALFNLDLASGAYSCARCHTLGWSYGQPTVSGQGAFGWNLTGGSVNNHFASQDDLVQFVQNGSVFGKLYGRNGQGTGRMPGFGSLLTDAQIDAILEYVRSL
jgi:mono/diheme cytochrome c family protein